MIYNKYISKKEALKCFKKYDESIIKNNSLYIERNLIALKEYFDHMYDFVDKSIKLDDEQRIAILKDEDYNIILAGAGSGKTTTLAAKVKFLVDIGKVNPKDIVVISFTNKAVDELKQRINNDFKIDCLICTFHKFGLLLFNNRPNIISDSYLIIKDILKDYLYSDKKLLKKLIFHFKKYFNIPIYILLFSNINKFNYYKDKILSFFNLRKNDNYIDNFAHLCTNFISQFKTKGYQEKDFLSITKSNEKEEIFIELIMKTYKKYQQILSSNNSLDFEDIINNAYLKLDDLSLNYKYIIVDEYQDISYQRFNLIKKASDISGAKIIAVGDDWQTS